MLLQFSFFILRIPPPPRSTRTDTLSPYPPLFRSRAAGHHQDAGAGLAGSIATRQNVGLSPHYFAQPTLSANRPFPDRRHTAQTSRRPEINSARRAVSTH